MADIIFEEIECKTIVNRVHPGTARNIPFRWSMNPYRGCQHACTYCFARGTHEFLGYDAGRDFETRVIVKTNAAEALRRDLGRPSWTRELIAIGTACDPYQQAELKYSLTNRCLRVMRDYANPVSITTKSPHIIRDIDLLEDLSREADVRVNFSISTLDAEVWKRIEPSTSKPQKRLEAMQKLAERGIRTGVLLAPILPGLTDDPASLEAVVRAARDHGASYVHDNVLYLRPGTREWFMPFLRESYPHLSERYAKFYRGAYAPQNYTQQVHQVVERLRLKFGLVRSEPVGPSAGQLVLAV